jgi:hypothetical protein
MLEEALSEKCVEDVVSLKSETIEAALREVCRDPTEFEQVLFDQKNILRGTVQDLVQHALVKAREIEPRIAQIVSGVEPHDFSIYPETTEPERKALMDAGNNAVRFALIRLCMNLSVTVDGLAAEVGLTPTLLYSFLVMSRYRIPDHQIQRTATLFTMIHREHIRKPTLVRINSDSKRYIFPLLTGTREADASEIP